jgi:hypothetical protein
VEYPFSRMLIGNKKKHWHMPWIFPMNKFQKYYVSNAKDQMLHDSIPMECREQTIHWVSRMVVAWGWGGQEVENDLLHLKFVLEVWDLFWGKKMF